MEKKIDTKAEGDSLMKLSKDWSELVKTADIALLLDGRAKTESESASGRQMIDVPATLLSSFTRDFWHSLNILAVP